MVLKILRKIARFLLSFIFAYLVTGVTLVLIQDVTKLPLLECSDLNTCGDFTPQILLYVILLIPIFILIYHFLKNLGSLILFITLVITLGTTFWFFATPYSVRGANVGPYERDQIVFGMQKILPWQQIRKGDVVVFPRDANNAIAQVVMFPGETVETEAYFLNKTILKGVVPVGYYVVKHDDSPILWGVAENEIKYIIWYPPNK